MNYGSMPALDVAYHANTECDLDILDQLPEISRRGITSKLNALSRDGRVTGTYPGGGSPMVWAITERGRWLADSLEDA
jgi:DNA-binding HxlR family transcriptional regulator